MSEEAVALKSRRAQQRQKESDEVDKDHVDDNEYESHQYGPDESRVLEHGRVVRKSHELCELDTRPVSHGVEDTKDQRDDDCDNKSKEKREQEDYINDLSVVLQSRKQVYAQHKSQDANHQQRASEGCLVSHEIECKCGNRHDCAGRHEDHRKTLGACRVRFHKVIPPINSNIGAATSAAPACSKFPAMQNCPSAGSDHAITVRSKLQPAGKQPV